MYSAVIELVQHYKSCPLIPLPSRLRILMTHRGQGFMQTALLTDIIITAQLFKYHQSIKPPLHQNTHTHKNTRTLTHAPTRTHTHTHTHKQKHIHSDTLINTHSI